MDSSFLNLLENFACEQDILITDKVTPDFNKTSSNQLLNPVEGQIWYNKTDSRIYYWNSVTWVVTSMRGDYAANWGMIQSGQQIPKPVSSLSGKVFDYNECIWTVSPAVYSGNPSYMVCYTDDNANVTMRYRFSGTELFVEGLSNYLIIGIGDANAIHEDRPVPPYPSATPSNTPSGTPASTPVSTPTRTPQRTPTRTPAPQPSQTRTPAPSYSATPNSTPNSTPTATPLPPTPTPTATPLPPPLNTIILGGNYTADSRVVSGACSGAGVGFASSGITNKTGQNTGGPARWMVAGYNAADFEISFSGDWFNNGPSIGFYQTPAGNNTMGSPSIWYNLGSGLAFSAGVCGNGLVDLSIGYAIRRVGDRSGEVVTGSITCSGTAGTPL